MNLKSKEYMFRWKVQFQIIMRENQSIDYIWQIMNIENFLKKYFQ